MIMFGISSSYHTSYTYYISFSYRRYFVVNLRTVFIFAMDTQNIVNDYDLNITVIHGSPESTITIITADLLDGI